MALILRRQILLGCGIALAAVGFGFFRPQPVSAQALICCCNIQLSRCADSPLMRGGLNQDGGWCPPDGSSYIDLTLIREPVPGTESATYQSCQNFVDPAAVDFANPNPDVPAASGMQPQSGGKSWVSAVVCPGKPDEDCEIIPKNCRVSTDEKGQPLPPCTLNDLLSILVRLSKLMLGVLGTAAFAMFIYGGFVFLLSQGNQERVAKGKSILLNAVIGILVVFVAWSLVNFVVNAFSVGRSGLGSTGSVFGNQWDRGP